MWTLYIRLATMVVEQMFVRIAGVAYAPPAGHVMVDVPRTVYVGHGFIATQTEAGWTFAPPQPTQEEPPALSAQDRLAAAEAKLAEVQLEINAAKAVLG